MTTAKAKLLKTKDVDWKVDTKGLDFDNTDKLEALEQVIGQPRAMRSLDIGLGIEHSTYNIYVSGLNGTGKKETIQRVLKERVMDKAPPSDWVYVYNFERSDNPIAIDLEAGKAVKFQKDMQDLVEQLKYELPKAFQNEDFSRQKQQISRKYEKENEKFMKELQQEAKDKDLTIQRTSNGQVMVIPLKENGEQMSQEDIQNLSEDEREKINQRERELAQKIDAYMSRGNELRKKLGGEVKKVEQDYAEQIVDPLIKELRDNYKHEKLDLWLDKLREHILENLEDFQQRDQDGQMQAMQQMMGGGQGQKKFTEYQVNVLVDNCKLEHAPVIIEDSPNYKNLFGTTGGVVDRFGRVVGDFTNIRAGSLLRANGGYLVLNLLEALFEPLVWKELKRTLKSGSVEFHAYDPLGVFTASAIRPESIPLKVKLVVLGNPLLYHLLYLYDEDFSEIFKIKADFADEMDISPDSPKQLGQFIQKLKQKENILPFTATGVAELTRTAVRIANHRKKLTAEFSKLGDIVREASFWAKDDGKSKVSSKHIRKAVDEKVYRSDRIAEKIRELIEEGTLIVNLEGKATGQVNGLAIINLGDYAFGRPSRVSASVGLGTSGVVNIERESKLSGQTYDKAMLILDGYLRNKYAQKHAISLSAGIAMEQSYGMIEGDSASVTELICLLSAVSGVPVRQDIAVTGSVDQWGWVQPVGGINEKIEGFFDTCRQIGLSGQQGVCIPAANAKNLILRPDVVDSIKKKEFSVWTIQTIDQAIQLFTGTEPGDVDAEHSFHGKIDKRLREMLNVLKKQGAVPSSHGPYAIEQQAPGQKDPRPPLPGREDSGLGKE